VSPTPDSKKSVGRLPFIQLGHRIAIYELSRPEVANHFLAVQISDHSTLL